MFAKIGKFAYDLMMNRWMLHKILIKHFSAECGFIKFFELNVQLKEYGQKFKLAKSPNFSFVFQEEKIECMLNSLFVDSSLTEIIESSIHSNIKNNKVWFLISVNMNFGRYKDRFHQCMIIINLKSNPMYAMFFDPYGEPEMYGIKYENVMKNIVLDMIPSVKKFVKSNIGNSLQTKILYENNKKFDSGEFEKEFKKTLSQCFPINVINKLLYKEKNDDEKDKTIATMNMFSEFGSEFYTLSTDCKNKLYTLFYKYTSKSCVSLTLIILYYYIIIKKPLEYKHTINILDNLKMFISFI